MRGAVTSAFMAAISLSYVMDLNQARPGTSQVVSAQRSRQTRMCVQALNWAVPTLDFSADSASLKLRKGACPLDWNLDLVLHSVYKVPKQIECKGFQT